MDHMHIVIASHIFAKFRTIPGPTVSYILSQSFLSVNYVLLPSPHHYSYPVVDAIDAGDQLAKHNSK